MTPPLPIWLSSFKSLPLAVIASSMPSGEGLNLIGREGSLPLVIKGIRCNNYIFVVDFYEIVYRKDSSSLTGIGCCAHLLFESP